MVYLSFTAVSADVKTKIRNMYMKLYIGQYQLFEDDHHQHRHDDKARPTDTHVHYICASFAVWWLLMLSGAQAGIFVCPFGNCGYRDAPEAFLCWNYETEAACKGELLPTSWKAAADATESASGTKLGWPCEWDNEAMFGYRPCQQSEEARFEHRETMRNNQYAVIFELHCLVYWIAALWASDSFLAAVSMAPDEKRPAKEERRKNGEPEEDEVAYLSLGPHPSKKKSAALEA